MGDLNITDHYPDIHHLAPAPVDRGQPEGRRANVQQMVEPGRDAAQVARPVTVRVLEGARVDLVDHAALPPLRWRLIYCTYLNYGTYLFFSVDRIYF